MPIPEEEEKNRDIEALKKRINLPEGWKIEYIVRPWMGCDIAYEVKSKERIVEIKVYSVTYPHSLYDWIDNVCNEINTKLQQG